MNSILKDNKGTALLVSLLVMGVLVSVAIALSGLVFRELTITKDFLNSGKAYYVAESGVELALFGLDKNLPGWEPSDEGLQKYYVGSLEGEYKLDNRCKTYPCFDGYNLTDGGEGFKEYYDVLDHNDSIQIPLFIVDDGSEKPVANFVVEFYATFDPSTHLNFDNVNDLSGWDILRWKIYGLNELFGITESISDFTAFSLLNTGDEEIRVNTNSTNPSWFGTKRCTDMVDRIQDDIYCAQVKFTPGDAVSIDILDASKFVS